MTTTFSQNPIILCKLCRGCCLEKLLPAGPQASAWLPSRQKLFPVDFSDDTAGSLSYSLFFLLSFDRMFLNNACVKLTKYMNAMPIDAFFDLMLSASNS